MSEPDLKDLTDQTGHPTSSIRDVMWTVIFFFALSAFGMFGNNCQQTALTNFKEVRSAIVDG